MSQPDIVVTLSCTNYIATITLDNPSKHNALGSTAIKQLIECLDRVEADSDVRVMILTGAGGKTFCAGASLAEMSSGGMTSEDFAALTTKLRSLRVPTVCKLNGSAYGGGCELALSCDFRIGHTTMRAFIPASRFGLCYPPSGIQRLVQVLGVNTAKRLLLSSEEFGAENLLNVGFLTHLVEADRLDNYTEQFVDRLAHWAPLAVQAMKKIADDAASTAMNMQEVERLVALCDASEDLKEGMLSVQEKRKPVFAGR